MMGDMTNNEGGTVEETKQDTLTQVLADVQPEVVRRVREQMTQSVVDSVGSSMKYRVSDAVAKYMDTEIGPAILAELNEQKPILVAAAVQAVRAAMDGIAAGVTGKIEKSFANSNAVGEVIQRLMRGY